MGSNLSAYAPLCDKGDGEMTRRLLSAVAELPIIDPLCRISPQEMAENRRYANITELWLYRDPRRQRAMRAAGISEDYITGSASDYEKFRAFCSAMPLLIGNPLYRQSHMELEHYFKCSLTLNEESCDTIWELTAERLASPGYRARELLLFDHVERICTTDDPASDLSSHAALRAACFPVRVLPGFCPERCMTPERRDFSAYIEALGAATGVRITDLDSLCRALAVSLDRFSAAGARTAIHTLSETVPFRQPDPYHANKTLLEALAGKRPAPEDAALLRAQLLRFLAGEYCARGILLLLPPSHPTSTAEAAYTAALLHYLYDADRLPRTLLYPEGEGGVALLDALYAEGALTGAGRGKRSAELLLGASALHAADSLSEAPLLLAAGRGALARHAGLTAQASDPLLGAQHLTFRHRLCRLLARWAESGDAMRDEAQLEAILRAICHGNLAALLA